MVKDDISKKAKVTKKVKFKIDKKDINTHRLSSLFDKILKYQEITESDIKSIDVEEIPNEVVFVKIHLINPLKLKGEKGTE